MENEDIMLDKAEKKRGKRRFLLGFIVGLAVMAAAGLVGWFVFQTVFYRIPVGGGETLLDKATTEKIDLITDVIDGNYYEEVDRDSLRTGLYRGLFDELDEYSQYFTPEEYTAMYESDISGTYSGIGATLQQDKETMQVTVIKLTPGSPAEESGLEVGDILLSADGYEASELTLSEFVDHVRGEEGTSVHLVVLHDDKECEFDVERRHLELPTIEYEMLQDQVGYIQISEFNNPTIDQFGAALEDLQDQGMESLIIDLRANPGGLVNAATEILDQLLPTGLLVYTEENDGSSTRYKSTDAESVDIPIVILVDEFSASASEIFAGAMQDRGAGTILGTTTYGKGVIQSVIPLTDGSAVKVTTSRYFTPNGVCIQGVGITPDVELEYEFLGGEDDVYSKDLDNQIQKAVEILTEK